MALLGVRRSSTYIVDRLPEDPPQHNESVVEVSAHDSSFDEHGGLNFT